MASMVHEAAARRAISEPAVTEVQALLGAGTRYEGKLAFEGCVRIDGEFEGEVRTDGILILGDTARVSGNRLTRIIRGPFSLIGAVCAVLLFLRMKCG